MTNLPADLAEWFQQSKRIVAFTGAGISTESGIPDFRSPGGVWARSQPVMFNDYLISAEARHEYWRQKAESHTEIFAATPNPAHQILAKWEQQGRLRGVITQNIDGLHQLAGSRQVLELHGTARMIGCLECEHREDADPLVKQFLASSRIPDCPRCGSLLKHATVSFGQTLPADVLQTAWQWAREADLMLTLGSSLVVEPAASLPRMTAQEGGKLVIINRDPTPLDALAACVLHAPLGEALKAIDRAVEALHG